MNKKVLAIIPARYGSSRFPGKPLVQIQGKSMIQRVVEQAQSCSALNEVIVATDDQRIHDHVLTFGGKVMMTQSKHKSGTDRCGEVLSKCDPSIDIVVNIQGDEPFIHPDQITQLVQVFENERIDISTLAKPITHEKELHNPNVVKVVKQKNSLALYFSRNPIPFLRDQEVWTQKHTYYKHIGIYAFRAHVLKELVQLPLGLLEQAECLEQLRWLENSFNIHVGLTEHENIGIDTPEDLEKLNNMIQNQGLTP